MDKYHVKIRRFSGVFRRWTFKHLEQFIVILGIVHVHLVRMIGQIAELLDKHHSERGPRPRDVPRNVWRFQAFQRKFQTWFP